MKNRHTRAEGLVSLPKLALNHDMPRRRCMRTVALCASMAAAIWIVAVLAYGDVKRRAAESLEDFARDQTTLAQCLAVNLHERYTFHKPLPAAQGDPVQWMAGLHEVELKGTRLLLFQPPDAPWFLTTSGQRVESTSLREAVAKGRSFLRLPRDEASRLGLPKRTAIAGLAQSDAGTAPTWHVAVVATALREREREEQESWRTLLAVLISAGAVLTLGGIALHLQSKELRVQRALELEEALRQHDQRLERAGRVATLGTLAMGITHELSTPLGIIATRAEQLQRRVHKDQDDRAARCVAAIQEQAERMSQIIRGMLGLVRGQNPTAVPLQSPDIARAAAALVKHRFAQSDIRLSLDIPEHLPRILGDKRLLEHAVINLLLNARDACAQDGQVILRVQSFESLVVFSIIDDGPGISLADAERAMEPFFTTKPAGEGTGLGLAIAHEIVKSHHGSLHIAPRPEGGTCAAITLPLFPEDDHAHTSPPPHPGG